MYSQKEKRKKNTVIKKKLSGIVWLWLWLYLRVRLFWVKMISGNHFHPFPHVWLPRKISYSGKWLPVDQFFHLWPGNQFLPSFSLQMTSGKRERERESPDQREREREERATIAPAPSTIDDRRDRAARSSIYRRDRRDRAARSMRSRGVIVDRAMRSTRSRGAIVNRATRSTSMLVGRTPLVGAIEELVAFLLLGFGFFCLIWCIFCKNIWMNQP